MAKSRKKKAKAARARKSSPGAGARHCGLCGKTTRLFRIECCGNWICDDEHTYRLFSYARNSCSRNHRRFTLCGYHFAEGHPGPWQKCGACRKDLEAEMFVHYGTNEYNFEKLQNPPKYEPTLCSRCGRRIVLGEEGYSVQDGKYACMACGDQHVLRALRELEREAGGGNRQ